MTEKVLVAIKERFHLAVLILTLIIMGGTIVAGGWSIAWASVIEPKICKVIVSKTTPMEQELKRQREDISYIKLYIELSGDTTILKRVKNTLLNRRYEH